MKLRASVGTLYILGMSKVKIEMETAYLMLDGACIYDCHYCSHARSSHASSSLLSRVIWKEVDSSILKLINDSEKIKRVCLQVVNYQGSHDDTLKIADLVRKPLSISTRPMSLGEIFEYFERGADRVGISIDVANESLFRKIRGGDLRRLLKLIEQAAERFPGRITTHLIVGLGESEEDLVRILQAMKDLGVLTALFAFTPVKGTKLQNHPLPSVSKYRRIQMARYYIYKGIVRYEDMRFDENGNIKDFGTDAPVPLSAFLPGGCPHCTRPFYTERPSRIHYNLQPWEVKR
ncbi:MAG: radical SAM protein [Thermotogaceae bacterium]|nr:radical SAM protein [Thermotogaceae bacterium]